ncbi:MAG: hypothetical protein MSG64_00575 [Pyrinomonadaceae bacterium MAG19_C2-C3]|nr:hypothetical protein [Pyrinomonadaceae bacterium MAG19_C2-C3]
MTVKQSRTLVVRRNTTQNSETHTLAMLPADIKGARHDLTFVPGQIAMLQLGDHEPAYFAFASAPADAELEFLIKRGSNAANDIIKLKAGDTLELVDVVGSGFPLDKYQGRDLVMVAMGTGIAPLRSALRHALATPERFGQIFMLYGARTPAAFCYTAEADEWHAGGIELRQVISQPDGYEWSGSTGYVQSLLDNVLPSLSAPVALVAGSSEMIDHTRDRLCEMGFAAEDVLTNY